MAKSVQPDETACQLAQLLLSYLPCFHRTLALLQHAMAKSAQRSVSGFTTDQECSAAYSPVS